MGEPMGALGGWLGGGELSEGRKEALGKGPKAGPELELGANP